MRLVAALFCFRFASDNAALIPTSLDLTVAALLIDMAIPLALLAILGKTSDTENQDCVDSYDTAQLACSGGPFMVFLSFAHLNVPTTPKTAVKMTSMKPVEKLEMAVAQPRTSAAAAGLGQIGLVTKAGVVLLR